MLCGETGFLKTIDLANAASDFSVSDPALQIFLALAAVFRLILFRIRREGVARPGWEVDVGSTVTDA